MQTASSPRSIRPFCDADMATIAMLVSTANKDVAVRFGLNAENCPKHPSFYTDSWVAADSARGERYFLMEDAGGHPLGCVAYENTGTTRAYLNRLSVLPAYRSAGLGAQLVAHVVQHARGEAITEICIGVIGEHTQLQHWYRQLGFVDGETKRFAHLPFSVKYMRLAVG